MEDLQMKTINWMMGLAVYFVVALIFTVASSSAAEVQDIQVGRIYYIEGELLRYVSEENDWVAVVEDAPFGVEDTFFSGSKGMTEMIVPNGSWIRLGNNTQIQFIALDPDLSEMDLASGVARVYNKGADTIIKVTSPFGYVLADPGTVFDFYVGENSAEVVAVKGAVSFVRTEGSARYDVSAGSPSILADQYRVSTGDGVIDPSWDRWNDKREDIWATRSGEGGKSAKYLPPSLRYDAHCLDEHGRWEMVHYGGGDYWFWRPTGVYVGWSPFTVGVWTEWYGDQTWIPAEPFGYITHHYGNWVFIGDFWYWAPPVVSVRVGFPLLDVGFYWYPGRVSWIHRGVYVGWVPLAPHETYYSRHNWGGPHHRVMKDDVAISINISIGSLSNSKHAVIVKQDKFHGVKDYRDVRVANVHPTIIDKYSAAPVVNNNVIKDYETNSQRHVYAKAVAQEKPNSVALDRIKHNETVLNRDGRENAESVRQQAKVVNEGNVSRDARVETPRITSHMEPAGDVNVPESEKGMRQTDAKSGSGTTAERSPGEAGRERDQQPGQTLTAPTQQDRSVDQPGGADNARQSQQERAVTQPERSMTLTAPTQQDRAVAQPGRTSTGAPDQQDRNVAQPGRDDSTRTTRQGNAVMQDERTSSGTSSQQGRSDTQTDRIGQSRSTGSGGDRSQQDVRSGSSGREDSTQERTSKIRSGKTQEKGDDREEEEEQGR